MSKKVYLYKGIRAELGLDMGYTSDKEGNLTPCEAQEKEAEADERTK